MAKSARSRQVKANNRKLKENVFGPVEAARAERLSAKLLEIASQPKPQTDVEMVVTGGMHLNRHICDFAGLKANKLLRNH